MNIKKCKNCNIEKTIDNFHPCGKYKDKVYYRGECRDCNKIVFNLSNKEACKKYRFSENGREKRKNYKKTDKVREYNKEYDKIRNSKPERKHKQYLNLKRKLETDPFFRLKHNMRNRVRNIFRSNKWHKDNVTSEILGCSLDDLKLYLEKQFSPQMTWENYAKIWELDHHIPLGLAVDKEEVYKLCHYTNLKPLSIEEHKEKTFNDRKLIKLKKNEQ